MTSSSNLTPERGLDTMLIVYSLLKNHPGSVACQQFIQSQTGWFTSALALLEVQAILTKVYGVTPTSAAQGLSQFARGPILFLELNDMAALSALNLANIHGLDLNDTVLLQLISQHGAKFIATEDQKMTNVCTSLGIIAQSPIDPILRQQIAAWEAAHVPPKGLPRVLRQVHHWLNQTYPAAAQDFWSQTGGGSHLP